MRAVTIEPTGAGGIHRVVDLPEPEPSPGQVRVRVVAAAVHPCDPWRAGTVAAVPGVSFAGFVDDQGDRGSGRFATGDRVVGTAVPGHGTGAWADLVVADAEAVVRAPSNATWAESAVLAFDALTASAALDVLGLGHGDVVLVTGAAGGVGAHVLALAELRSVRPAALVRADAVDDARGLGARYVVRDSAVAPDVLWEIFRQGVGGVVDAADIRGRYLAALGTGTTLVSLSGWDGGPDTDRVCALEPTRHLRDPGRLDELVASAELGDLPLRVSHVALPADADAAVARANAGRVRGRVVLDFS